MNHQITEENDMHMNIWKRLLAFLLSIFLFVSLLPGHAHAETVTDDTALSEEPVESGEQEAAADGIGDNVGDTDLLPDTVSPEETASVEETATPEETSAPEETKEPEKTEGLEERKAPEPVVLMSDEADRITVSVTDAEPGSKLLAAIADPADYDEPITALAGEGYQTVLALDIQIDPCEDAVLVKLQSTLFDGLDDEKETLPVLYRVCGEDGEKSALILDYTFDPDLSEVSFKTKEFSLFVLAYPAMPELTVTPELAELNRKLEPSAGLNSVSDTNYSGKQRGLRGMCQRHLNECLERHAGQAPRSARPVSRTDHAQLCLDQDRPTHGEETRRR